MSRSWKSVVLSAALLLAFVLGVYTARDARATIEHPTPTPVYFANVHDGIPRTVDLYDRLQDGTRIRQELGTVIENPLVVCPKNDHYRIVWGYGNKRILFGRDRLDPGTCLLPGPGPTVVNLIRAGS